MPQQARQMAQAAGGRITVVRADGKVLVDSEADAAGMENHRTRPELVEAFRAGAGSDIRQSATIGVSFLYVAVPVAGGSSAIRIAFPLSEINRQVAPDPRQDSGQHGAGVSAGDSDRGAAGALHLAALCGDHVARRRTGARQFPRAAAGDRFERVRAAGADAERDRRKSAAHRGAACSASTPSWKNWSACARIS